MPSNTGSGNAAMNPSDYHDYLSEPTSFASAPGSGTSIIYQSPSEVNFKGYGTTIDLTQYAGFQISALPGYELTLTNLVYNNASQGPETISFQWGYRIDLNSDGDFLDGAEEGWTLGKLWTDADGADFAPIRYARPKTWTFTQPIVTQGTVEFGLFASSTDSNVGLRGFAYTVNGDIAAVPEPSTYALLIGAACVTFVYIRRRTSLLTA